MNLTPAQRDALSELLNIAFGKTAASLSTLTGHRILVQAPDVEVVPIAELDAVLQRYMPGDVAAVHQNFEGPLSGDAYLLLSRESALELTGLITNEGGDATRSELDESAREVLTEVGNIVLNACLGTVGNLLNVRVAFSVPHARVERVSQVTGQLQTAASAVFALIISMAFQVKDAAVSGYLALVLGVTSLEGLVDKVERWEPTV